MTITIEIREEGCRGCRMCVDVCPTDVLSFDEATRKARVKEADNCIACLSCSWLCPSGTLRHDNFHAVRNFYRDLSFSRRIARFL